eukprot:221436_1
MDNWTRLEEALQDIEPDAIDSGLSSDEDQALDLPDLTDGEETESDDGEEEVSRDKKNPDSTNNESPRDDELPVPFDLPDLIEAEKSDGEEFSRDQKTSMFSCKTLLWGIFSVLLLFVAYLLFVNAPFMRSEIPSERLNVDLVEQKDPEEMIYTAEPLDSKVRESAVASLGANVEIPSERRNTDSAAQNIPEEMISAAEPLDSTVAESAEASLGANVALPAKRWDLDPLQVPKNGDFYFDNMSVIERSNGDIHI